MGFIIVIGRAEGSVRPDRASFQLALTRLDMSVAEALRDVGERSTRLEALLANHGLTPDDWTTGGVTVNEEWEWRADHNELVGHRASLSTQVRVTDPARLSGIISDAVTEASAQVNGLGWHVDISNPARLALCEQATHDARRRAEAYVRGLNLRLGAVETISEIPLTSDSTQREAPMAFAAKMADTNAGSDVSVNAGEVGLSATVHIRFRLIAD